MTQHQTLTVKNKEKKTCAMWNSKQIKNTRAGICSENGGTGDPSERGCDVAMLKRAYSIIFLALENCRPMNRSPPASTAELICEASVPKYNRALQSVKLLTLLLPDLFYVFVSSSLPFLLLLDDKIEKGSCRVSFLFHQEEMCVQNHLVRDITSSISQNTA